MSKPPTWTDDPWQEVILQMRNTKDQWDDTLSERFDDLTRKHFDEIIGEFKSGKDRVSWNRIPAAKLKKVWLDFGRTGVVRDEKAMQKIAEDMMSLIARLYVTNALSGHDTYAYGDELSDEGIAEMDDKLMNFLTGPQGEWYVSDFGLPRLLKILPKIWTADTSEKQLYAVDMALNVIHQRGDLSDFFVEGGSGTLNEIASQT